MDSTAGDPALGPSEAPHYDVVIIGGGFSGSSLALLLARRVPGCRILILERRETFDRKVGEATVEVSGFFLHHVLGVYDSLSRDHLPKHGLRFWFSDRSDRSLSEMTEVGPRFAPHLPSFQLDRSKLDESLLRQAESEGARVERRARVSGLELSWPENRVSFESVDGQRTVRARWVVDASGRRAYVARHLGLWSRTENHPTAAVWSRWRGVGDLDEPEVLRSAEKPDSSPLAASRRLATNHFCGYGWWCWVIPLSGGETSVGLVYHKDLFELPGAGNIRSRYRDFVTSRPGLRDLLAEASMEERDCRTFPHLAYYSSQYADKGWALVGDAASFIDPYYSPGLDHAALSIYRTAGMLEHELLGNLDEESLEAGLDEHNDLFERSYRRWLEALYLDKYEILGDSELCSAAFLIDTSMYYMGVVSPVYESAQNLDRPVFGGADRGTTGAYRFLAAFNRRLVRLARFRRRAGTYGRRNADRRVWVKSPSLGRGALPMFFQGLRIWLRAEWEFFVYRCTHRRLDPSAPEQPRHEGTSNAT